MNCLLNTRNIKSAANSMIAPRRSATADRDSCDTLPPQLGDDETNFALFCVFFLMNNADWMINLLQKISNIYCFQHYDLEMVMSTE